MKGAGEVTNSELSEMLIKLSQGDKGAFEEIYNEINTSAFTVIYRITQDRHLSEDILQELFVRLYRNPPSAPIGNPRAYLMRMAHNLTIDVLRKQENNADIEDYENVLSDKRDSTEEKIDLDRALKCLSKEERQLVVLHVNGGFKFREISDIMGIPPGTAMWKYHKAIKRLRDILNGGSI